MSRSRPRPTALQWTPGKFLVLFLAIACLFTVAFAATSSPGSPAPASSPKQQQQKNGAASDLICHTDVAAECYPRIFEATTEFQRVHEDQDLPPGLHIRLDMTTGLREAKLNNESEELPAGLAGLPVDNSVVLVDQPASENEDTVVLPKNAPKYDPAGLVKDPGASASAITFHESIDVVKGVAVGQVGSGKGQINLSEAEQSRFIDALNEIDDVAHDIYYGLKLAEDHVITRQLLCLMSGGNSGSGGRGLVAAQKAAAVAGAAVQNNPTALGEIEQQWETYKKSLCLTASGGDTPTTLGDVVFGPYDHDAVSDEVDHPAWIRSRLLAINGLIKNEAIMKDFLAGDGLTEVLRLLIEYEGNSAYDAVRQRAANLINDNFLDASMGADVSLWPKATAVQRKPCDGQVHTHCWDHHIQQLAKTHKKDKGHWSHELLKGLQEREKGASGKSEL